MLRWVTQIVHLRPEEALFEIGTSSDSLEVVPAAVYCFLKNPRQFAGAVLAAVNAGDAADSVAALTGSFVGALAGLAALPLAWRDEIEDGDILVAVAAQLAAVAESQ
jgi:ADP-ribosylglycohydrolase